jgi:hypothetical protein
MVGDRLLQPLRFLRVHQGLSVQVVQPLDRVLGR